MFKSIFSKYYTVISSIIIISFLAMQGAQLFLSSRYWLDENHAVLQENAHTIAAHTAENVQPVKTPDGVVYPMDKAVLSPFIRLLSVTLDCTVVIADTSGTVQLMCNKEGREVPVKSSVSLSGLVNKGEEYYAVGTLNGIYDERQYTSGVPIRRGDTLIGYVFVSTSAEAFGQYLRDNVRMVLLSALGVLTVTFIALYIMTDRLVRPLRKMAVATRKFAEGDFSYVIPVSGRDETAELAQALNNMAHSLSSLENMRRSFVANVSHELRTPMTSIAGFIDGILDGTIPEEKREYYLQIVTDEVKRLSRLVHSMLALSRIDSGQLKLNMVDFDMVGLTGQTLLTFEKRIADKNISIEGLEEAEPITVTGDYDLIGQAVYNLLDNAVKFTNEGGSIRITLSKDNGRITCSIRNTGAGIPAQEMPRIFERFYKSDRSRSVDKNGVGLGLYIVQTVIGLHRGEVFVRSKEGEYTEFRFWLPENKLTVPPQI